MSFEKDSAASEPKIDSLAAGRKEGDILSTADSVEKQRCLALRADFRVFIFNLRTAISANPDLNGK